VVARLIDPALPRPHRFMPPSARRRDDRQPNPRPCPADLRHTWRPNPTTSYPAARCSRRRSASRHPRRCPGRSSSLRW